MSELAKIDKSQIFLPNEYRILEKTLEIREKIVDKLLEEGIPTKSRDIRVLNEVLNAMDANVLGRVDRRLKREENDNQEEFNKIAVEIILNWNKMKQERVTEPIEVPELDRELPDDMVVPDEDSLEYKELTMEDIIEGARHGS